MNNMISIFADFTQADSLFQKMIDMGAPWSAQEAMSMDMSYFMMYSGLKTPSSFVKLNIMQSGSPNSQRIAQILWDMFGKNWVRLWNVLNTQYNPIDNYNIIENIKRDKTDNRTIGKKGTINQTTQSNGESSLDHGENISTSRNINNSRFGFNSAEAVPTDAQVMTGTEGHSGIDKTTTDDNSTLEGTSTDDTTDNDILGETISRDRTGNVGQNSYQELLKQELELWKWSFFETVFSDCDKYLCLSVYDPCSSVN